MPTLQPLGLLHFVTAVLAIVVGGAVLLLKPKGGRWHRRLGLFYVALMITVNASALMIYRLLGTFGPFHVFAVISLVGIVLGWRAALRAKAARASGNQLKRSAMIERHYYWISWSYVGLMAAAASETLTRLPAFHFMRSGGLWFALGVAGATLAVVSVGAWRINGAGRVALAPFIKKAS